MEKSHAADPGECCYARGQGSGVVAVIDARREREDPREQDNPAEPEKGRRPADGIRPPVPEGEEPAEEGKGQEPGDLAAVRRVEHPKQAYAAGDDPTRALEAAAIRTRSAV